MCIFCTTCKETPGSAGASDVYRFSRADFIRGAWAPLHYDLEFDFPTANTAVKVTSRQTYMNVQSEPCSTLVLNAHNLKDLSVSVLTQKPSALGPPPVGKDAKVPDFVAHVKELDASSLAAVPFDYNEDKRMLTISFNEPVKPGDEIVIKTVSTCHPDDKELEGIYFDFTPPGKPQTMISQCQQYGFQRIVPCVDTMNAKTFFTTRITASSEYSNIVSNGDLLGDAYMPASDGRVTATYYNHNVNMAPYLFFIGVGTYDTHVAEVEYPNGQTFAVEILALPGVIDKPEDATSALQSLVDSIIWTQISTGPEKYEHEAERAKIYDLIAERDSLKRSSSDPTKLASIRAELKDLVSVWKDTGYTYTFKTYREIGMQNSNYGGMENLNNTTILSSRLTPSRWLVDGGHVYMEGVKVHEFYHNINGSQTTGETPFEIWLNEAVTVHIQRQREDAIFGHDYMRLGQVAYAQAPGTGPLALDKAPSSMAVEPAGFNTTQELVSAMTYSKAPEFIRMVQAILGKEKFVQALFNYHSKFAFSNATSGQWVDCMCDFSPPDVDLKLMAKGWLQRTSFPTLVVESEEVANSNLTVSLKQVGFAERAKEEERYPWMIPVEWSAVKDGKSVKSGLYILKEETGSIAIENMSADSFDFVSVACDWSFYGDVKNHAMTDAKKLCQAKTDPDTVNRFLAFQNILDNEKCKIVEALRTGVTDGLVSVSSDFVDLYGAILEDSNLSISTKGRFLSISSSCPSRPELSHFYHYLDSAKRAILQAVYARYGDKLTALFAELQADSKLENRTLKQATFAAIKAGLASAPVLGGGEAPANGKDSAAALLYPLLDADNMSDRAFALKNTVELGGAKGAAAHANAKKVWTEHTIGCEQYIQCIASVDSEAAPGLIRELLEEPFFNMALAGHARTVARAWCANQKRALLTKEGLQLTKELFIKVGKVNQMSAYGFLGTFSQVMKFDKGVRDVLCATVREMKDDLDPKEQESLFNQFSRLVKTFD
ncbi:hypothetical protein TL16_g03833 [Triparma laevis f. inornata]|uniref:Uncharacterized protein n=2 Tax=Triparma laevis TaxID=1534972 RepID=A0A9W7CK61_9STRA|nr:hypothetical protein TL16_g03833 [Triparma laevis f. inornata]GMI07957.1 hypothetical protein TrLO_g80 [Triparma laevis f. longispina]